MELRCAAGQAFIAEGIVDDVVTTGLDEGAECAAGFDDAPESEHERGVVGAAVWVGAAGECAGIVVDERGAFGEVRAGGGSDGLVDECLAGIDRDDGAAEATGGGDGDGALAAREVEDARAGPDAGTLEHVDDDAGAAAETGHVFEEEIEDGKEGGGGIDGACDLAAE